MKLISDRENIEEKKFTVSAFPALLSNSLRPMIIEKHWSYTVTILKQYIQKTD
jgi:hypothetical protein